MVLTDAHSGHNGDEDGQVACDLHDGDLCYVAEGERLRRGGVPKRRESRIRDNSIRKSRGYDRVLSIHVVARSPFLGIMSRGGLLSRPRAIFRTLCVPSSSSKSTPPRKMSPADSQSRVTWRRDIPKRDASCRTPPPEEAVSRIPAAKLKPKTALLGKQCYDGPIQDYRLQMIYFDANGNVEGAGRSSGFRGRVRLR